MAQCRLEIEIDAPANAVWSLLNWEGVTRRLEQLGSIRNVRLAGGTGLGEERVLELRDGPPVRERLEAMDEAARTYTYRIIEAGALPVDDYVGVISVRETDVTARAWRSVARISQKASPRRNGTLFMSTMSSKSPLKSRRNWARTGGPSRPTDI